MMYALIMEDRDRFILKLSYKRNLNRKYLQSMEITFKAPNHKHQIPCNSDSLEFGIQCRLVKEIICTAGQSPLRPLRNLCILFAVKGIYESIQKPQRAPSLRKEHEEIQISSTCKLMFDILN